MKLSRARQQMVVREEARKVSHLICQRFWFRISESRFYLRLHRWCRKIAEPACDVITLKLTVGQIKEEQVVGS